MTNLFVVVFSPTKPASLHIIITSPVVKPFSLCQDFPEPQVKSIIIKSMTTKFEIKKTLLKWELNQISGMGPFPESGSTRGLLTLALAVQQLKFFGEKVATQVSKYLKIGTCPASLKLVAYMEKKIVTRNIKILTCPAA